MVADEPVALRLNGRDTRLPGLAPTATLLHAVRAAGLVGTKEGCGDGDCGACTVVVRAPGPDGTVVARAVNSCLLPVGAVVGAEVVTVEGVSARGEELHPVQQAMVDCAGSQCGYCTPGFVMSMYAGYEDPHARSEDGLDETVVEGNLCRCTGYASIRRACTRLGGEAPPRSQVREPGVPVPVRAQGRLFARPGTLAQALALLVEHPDATVVAGGTDVGLDLSHHRVDPLVTVSVEHVAQLQRLEVVAGTLRIGAGVTLTRLEREAVGHAPALDEMVRWFAARQIRNRATVGGNLGTASPIGDLPPVLLALDAEVVLTGLDGSRTVPLEGFFTGYRTTQRRPEELIERIDVPLGPVPGAARRLSQSYKVGKRGTDDISIVAGAFVVDLADDDTVVHARLGYGGVAATPVRAHAAERALLGRRLDDDTVAEVAALLLDAFSPLDDLRGSAAYRRRLVAGLFEKFVAEHAPGGRPTAEHEGVLV